MKVAFCLFGQPRRARQGHAILSAFMQRNPDVSFDVYFHVWHDPSQTHYAASPWRPIDEAELRVDKDVVEFLLEAYRPVSWKIEPPRPKFDIPGIEQSPLFQNSNRELQANVTNSLSQLYSKQAVRDLVKKSGVEYDMVVASRFDFLNPIDINLHELDVSKMYAPAFHLPRAIFSDAFLIAGPAIFFPLFNAYADLPYLMNARNLHEYVQTTYHEPAVLATEAIMLAAFVDKFDVRNHIVYTPAIPDFH